MRYSLLIDIFGLLVMCWLLFSQLRVR